jgi:ABC-type multidrug transport system ATPase subunit
LRNHHQQETWVNWVRPRFQESQGLAQALVLEAEILLLDEPTDSLDPENTAGIEDIILKLRLEARTVVIMATHDMEQVKRITDRLLKIDQGRMVAA